VTSARAPTVRVARLYWRVLAPKWAHDPLSCAGAALRGGRFNPPGMPALYMSEEFVTAVAEYEQDLGIRPGTLYAYDVDSERVVDLADARTLVTLGVDAPTLRGPGSMSPWSKSFRLGPGP
jgi:RES domain-containing protein